MLELIRRLLEILFSHNDASDSEPAVRHPQSSRDRIFNAIILVVVACIPPLLYYAFQHFNVPPGYQQYINFVDLLLIFVITIFILMLTVIIFLAILVGIVRFIFPGRRRRPKYAPSDPKQAVYGYGHTRTSSSDQVYRSDRLRQQRRASFQRFIIIAFLLIFAVAYYIVLNQGNLPFNIPLMPVPSP